MIEQQQQQIILEAGNQDQGVGRFGSLETSLLGLQMASFSLYAHVVFHLSAHLWATVLQTALVTFSRISWSEDSATPSPRHALSLPQDLLAQQVKER